MTGPELLAELGLRGVFVEADGEELRVDAPEGALTPALLGALREHKPRLPALLRPAAEMRNDGYCGVHGRYPTFAEALHGACSWCEVDPKGLACWPGNRKGRGGGRAYGPDGA